MWYDRIMKHENRENVKDRLYIATVCAEHKEIIERFGLGVELDHFCMAEVMEGQKWQKADAEIRPLLAKAPRSILHAPFNELFPAAIDPKAKALAFERLESAAELAVHYGVRKMVVHSGYVPNVYFKEWHIERSIEFWHRFMEGKPADFQIVIENVMEDEPYMMVKLMEGIEKPNVRLCLDVGHAACISDVPVSEWLDVLAPYLGHLHVHNNDGVHDLHDPLPEGVIPMDSFMEDVAAKCGEDTTITLECLSGISSVKWLVSQGYLEEMAEAADLPKAGRADCSEERRERA